MHLRAMMGLWPLFFGASLSACASKPDVVERIERLPPAAVPEHYLAPCPKPAAADPATATQRDAADLLNDYDEALENCNADKAAIADIVRKQP